MAVSTADTSYYCHIILYAQCNNNNVSNSHTFTATADVINIVEHLIPSLSPNEDSSQDPSLDQLFRLHTCTLLYFSAGSGIGTDIRSLPEFKSMKVVFNSLQFTMRHNKGETHGH